MLALPFTSSDLITLVNLPLGFYICNSVNQLSALWRGLTELVFVRCLDWCIGRLGISIEKGIEEGSMLSLCVNQ